jgi:hypothetical protein
VTAQAVPIVSNTRSTPASFLHNSDRADGKLINRTAANLQGWPVKPVETLRALLRGDKLVAIGGGGIT